MAKPKPQVPDVIHDAERGAVADMLDFMAMSKVLSLVTLSPPFEDDLVEIANGLDDIAVGDTMRVAFGANAGEINGLTQAELAAAEAQLQLTIRLRRGDSWAFAPVHYALSFGDEETPDEGESDEANVDVDAEDGDANDGSERDEGEDDGEPDAHDPDGDGDRDDDQDVDNEPRYVSIVRLTRLA